MFDIGTHDTTAAAPGDLEVLQRFLNLHEHVPGGPREGLPPPPKMVRSFLVDRGLLEADAPYTDRDHRHAMALFDALHADLSAGGRPAGARTIEETAERAGLRVRFGAEPGLEPGAAGVDAALGRLVAVVFLAELDGRWAHMKECSSETCHSVFFDRSRNRSGRWCSMQSCGNVHKVRAWRERRRSDAVDA